MRAAREGAGADIALMNDVNCPWSVAQALEMERAFRPSNLYWLEEPVWPPEDHDGLARVRRSGATRIAAGENAAGLHDFVDQFQKGSIDIAQPSVTKIGGITEMRKIIAAAEAHSVELVPHCAYFGPGNLASIHIVASLATDTLLENIYVNLEANPFGDAMLAKDGKVRVPTGPRPRRRARHEGRREIPPGPRGDDPVAVIPGLVPGIHAIRERRSARRAWIPVTSTGMTMLWMAPTPGFSGHPSHLA